MQVENSTIVWQGNTKDIEFSYTDFKGNKTRRKVKVNKVLFDKNKQHFYINGFCQERNSERDFKEDNISTMIKVGSKRYDFQEWMWTLDIEITDYLDNESGDYDHNEHLSPKRPDISTANTEKPVIEESTYTVGLLERKVSPLLGIGVFIMPIIFSWFTLRKGYSKAARIFSFLWLGFIVYNVGFDVTDAPIESAQLPTSVKPTFAEALTETKKSIESEDQLKWLQFEGISDCMLARKIIKDHLPIMKSLSQFVVNTPNLTYQKAVEWKKSTEFDAQLSATNDRYPSYYNIYMQNSAKAHGLNFRISQYWNDVFSKLRKSNNQNQSFNDNQLTSLIKDNFDFINGNCKAEWNANKTSL